MDWNKIADAIEATADALPELNAFSEVPDQLPTIGFYVGEMDITPNITMRGQRTAGGPRRGTDEATITCRVLVARMDDKSALRKLRDYMGGSGVMSLVDALEQNRYLKLNGVETVDDSKVVSIRGNRLFDVGGSKYYGVEVDIYVIGSA